MQGTVNAHEPSQGKKLRFSKQYGDISLLAADSHNSVLMCRSCLWQATRLIQVEAKNDRHAQRPSQLV